MSPSRIGQSTFKRANACEFQLPDSEDYHCPHDRYTKADRVCIFHLPKPSDHSKPQSSSYQKLAAVFRASLEHWIYDPERAGSELDLRGFQFPEFQFKPKAFPTTANFDYAVFNADILFNVEIPKSKPENAWDTHESSLLRNGASFEHAHFKSDVGFGGCLVDNEFSFREAVFDGRAVFGGITLVTCDFSEAIFNKEADFSHANIGYANFDQVQFLDVAKFSTFVAEEGVFFDRAEFHKPMDFWRGHFGIELLDEELVVEEVSPDVESRKAPDRIQSGFGGTVFHETVQFSEMYFNAGVYFNGTIFRKRALFWGNRGNMFSEGAEFANVILPKDEELIFEQVDLTKTGFHDTFLDKIVFRDVIWGKVTGRFRRFFRGNCYVLWDEVRPVQGMYDWLDDAKTADNYRQLVINYEKKRDYETAEAFHISEMELRRRAVGERSYQEPTKLWKFLLTNLKLYPLVNLWARLRKYINGYGLYWLSSRYGTSYRHAIVVLVFMLVTFSIIFLYSGLDPTPENTLQNARTIEYTLFPDENHPAASVTQILCDWRESFFYTLEIATFQKEKFYQPTGAVGRGLVYPAVLLLAGQAALLLLSIRRRFRRE